MKRRMVHTRDGKTESQADDTNEPSRRNICIADYPSPFQHKLLTVDFDERVMIFHSGERNEEVKVSFDASALMGAIQTSGDR